MYLNNKISKSEVARLQAERQKILREIQHLQGIEQKKRKRIIAIEETLHYFGQSMGIGDGAILDTESLTVILGADADLVHGRYTHFITVVDGKKLSKAQRKRERGTTLEKY